MKEWNVVLTSQMGQERRLEREVAGLGEFQPSGFREVILGQVPEPEAFLEVLKGFWEEKAFFSQLLSTAVPVRLVFPFTLENLVVRLKEEVLPLMGEIGDRPFYVRMKRRGHKGELSSLEVEQALDQFLKEKLAARGFSPRIDFDHPEVIVLVETVHNQCGLGLVTREMKERYPFIKIK